MSLIPGDALLIADVQHNFLLDGALGSSAAMRSIRSFCATSSDSSRKGPSARHAIGQRWIQPSGTGSREDVGN